ncbi:MULTISPECIES: hypothetical protein [Sphingomonas]|uniref:hypothetical protein n=1 Tax=Sphingomonas TaxID=13687 RepID=UPI001E298DFD|nr:hypothetical protein [Sphingomonas sp. CCH10-B3]
MAYWKIALGVIVIVGLAAAAFFFFVSPPRQLDLIDGMMGSEGDSARVAEGVRFGDQPRQQLDVWAPANAQGKKLPVLIFYYGGSWRWARAVIMVSWAGPLLRAAMSSSFPITGWCRRCASPPSCRTVRSP